jgi:hypothetical protein
VYNERERIRRRRRDREVAVRANFKLTVILLNDNFPFTLSTNYATFTASP